MVVTVALGGGLEDVKPIKGTNGKGCHYGGGGHKQGDSGVRGVDGSVVFVPLFAHVDLVRCRSNGRFMEESARLSLRDRRTQAEFAEPCEHHPLALRPGQRRGPGVTAARFRTGAAGLRLRR